jgi:hypothetical protein
MSIEQVFWGSIALLLLVRFLAGWQDDRDNRKAHALRDHLLRCDPDEVYDESGHV